ncbi:MAG: hypothetical protein H0W83_04610 [Planctomycetes bacterium]|nr:hypothetical protein [Planctomycetota bacterium]
MRILVLALLSFAFFQAQSAEFTKESAKAEFDAMLALLGDPAKSKAFIERYAEPKDLAMITGDHDGLDAIAKSFNDDGKRDDLMKTLKAMKDVEPVVNEEKHEMVFKTDTRDTTIVLIDGTWYLRNN